MRSSKNMGSLNNSIVYLIWKNEQINGRFLKNVSKKDFSRNIL